MQFITRYSEILTWIYIQVKKKQLISLLESILHKLLIFMLQLLKQQKKKILGQEQIESKGNIIAEFGAQYGCQIIQPSVT